MHRSQRRRAAAITVAAVTGLCVLAAHRPGPPAGTLLDRDVVAVGSWAAWSTACYLLFAVSVAASQCLRAPACGRLRLPAGAVVGAWVQRWVGIPTTVGIAVVAASAGASPAAAAASPSPPPPAVSASLPSLDWAQAAPAPVTVHPGDSLWRIAAHELGGEATPALVAKRWPQWWLANRNVIGTDPDLIHPGQRLSPPASPPWRS